MYYCPTCREPFKDSESCVKHMLSCWREHNPNVKSKPAPRSEETVRNTNNDMNAFFARFK